MKKNITKILSMALINAMLFTGCSSSAQHANEKSPEETNVESQDNNMDATNDNTNIENNEVTTEEQVTLDFNIDYEGIERSKMDLTSAAVHDPSIIKAGDTYYIFGSHLSAAKSSDLTNWEMMTSIKNSYSVNNPVYSDMKHLDSDEFAFTGNGASVIPTEDKTTHIWAPDVIYNKKQNLYYMYYCTSSTFNASTIVYGVSESVEGPYEWKGNLLYSGETISNIENTDILDYVDYDTAIERYTTRAGYEYNFEKYPNCIDPTVFYDEDDRLWMVYGSWSGGIFLIEIDEETGEVIHPVDSTDKDVDPYYGKRLLGGGHHSIEGPYILYDKDAGYYYLFVSYGELKRDGGYQIRVFRSKTVDGDYVDMNDAKPDDKTAHNFFGLKLTGNYYLPSLEFGYKATGHNSAFIDDDGKRYVVYHTRYDKASEAHTPKAKQYLLNKEGWPCVLPYITAGETVSDSGYDNEKITGRYYCINQGTGIDGVVAAPFIMYLMEDGTVVGDSISGSWKVEDGTCYMNITYDDKEYSGVFVEMKDEAGTDVMTFTAVGSNESVWGVKY